MSNLDKAERVIAKHLGSSDPYSITAGQTAEALEAAGLLMPDLPEANDPGIFVPGGKGWRIGDVSVWTAPDSPIMIQNVEPGHLSPSSTRELAYALLAAADYAEKGQSS